MKPNSGLIGGKVPLLLRASAIIQASITTVRTADLLLCSGLIFRSWKGNLDESVGSVGYAGSPEGCIEKLELEDDCAIADTEGYLWWTQDSLRHIVVSVKE